MFGAAQKFVSVVKFGQFVFRKQFAVGKTRQAFQSVRGAQPFVRAAVSDLQSLRDKFDFADSAASEFDVKTFLRRLFEIDFFFGKPDVFERVFASSRRLQSEEVCSDMPF